MSIRVWELAEKCGVTDQDMLDYLVGINYPVKRVTSTVDEVTAASVVREHIRQRQYVATNAPRPAKPTTVRLPPLPPTKPASVQPVIAPPVLKPGVGAGSPPPESVAAVEARHSPATVGKGTLAGRTRRKLRDMLGELRAALRWTFSGGARQTYRGGTWYGDNVLGNDEAEEIVRAFGRFLAERQPVIPDVDRLPHRKIKIWEAFKKWEQDLCDWGNIHRESGNTKMEKAVKAQLENIRGCQVILWGYSRIDPEDKAAVKYFNSFRRFKDVPEGKRHEAIELRLKYSERGQAEVMAWELGAAYRQAGRTDDATAAFVEARKLNPELFK